MANVIVAMHNREFYRATKDGDKIAYGPGMVEMPIEHAKAMGLLHRVRGVPGDEVDSATRPMAYPFDGVFDDKLTATLEAAGYSTLADLRKASQDELLATNGVGPAAFERIQAALKGA